MTQLTTDTVVDDNPQLGFDPTGNLVLTWLKDSELSSSVNLDMNQRVVIRKDESGYSSNLADFKLAQSSDGKLAIVWAEPSKDHSSDLHALFYNPAGNVWGGLRPLTADSETEKRLTATFFGTDTLVTLYNRSQVGEPTTTPASGNVPVQIGTDLYMLKHTTSTMDFIPTLPTLEDARGLSVSIDNTGNFGSPEAKFFGGVTLSGGNFTPSVTVTPQQEVVVKANIEVAPEDIGKTADLLFVTGIEPPPVPYDGGIDTLYFAYNNQRMSVPVDLYASVDVWMAQLVEPFQQGVTLQATMPVDLWNGKLEAPSMYYFFTGYRLEDGTIIYNPLPIMVNVE